MVGHGHSYFDAYAYSWMGTDRVQPFGTDFDKFVLYKCLAANGHPVEDVTLHNNDLPPAPAPSRGRGRRGLRGPQAAATTPSVVGDRDVGDQAPVLLYIPFGCARRSAAATMACRGHGTATRNGATSPSVETSTSKAGA